MGMEINRCLIYQFHFFIIQSGNVGVDKSTGQPIIFDPASYYGHNEAEYVSLSSTDA